MEEELGYRIGKVERLFELYVTPAEGGGGLAEEGEDIEVIETTLEQAVAMIAAGDHRCQDGHPRSSS
jgi:GDP-mannose pyrophosphatase NudK